MSMVYEGLLKTRQREMRDPNDPACRSCKGSGCVPGVRKAVMCLRCLGTGNNKDCMSAIIAKEKEKANA